LYESVAASIDDEGLPDPDFVIAGVGTQIRHFPSGLPVSCWERGHDRDWNGPRLHAALADESDLELQPAEFQSDRKLSYWLRNATPARLSALRERIAELGYCVEMVYSSERDLDVLPRGVNKGSAAAHLVGQWDEPADRVIVSGDSGNDLSLFLQGFRGIVVANAHAELTALVGRSVYLASQPYADGVVEGLSFWSHTTSPPLVDTHR
jgi:sucrose-6F-phosphate phosphohydrolase